ncbi:site-specific integrase [Edaphobacter aggregans]|uniref:site-specific integrase n=1 Tax=Edaphobacter aggregans TaxID=570835 RepID=UPI0007E8D45D|nr:site-specific integrase [Edaphobacter aggregans]
MVQTFFKRSCTIDRLRQGPLAGHIDLLAARLATHGYSRVHSRIQLRLVGHFNRWLEQKRLTAEQLDEDVIERYRRYLKRRKRVRSEDVCTLVRLLDLLREQGVTPRRNVEATPTAREILLEKYRRYLREERGLSDASLRNMLMFVDRFLVEKYPREHLDFAALAVGDITTFVRRQATDLSSVQAKHLVTALRSFFRYLRHCGEIDTDLAGCVPRVPDYSFSAVPKFLPAGSIEKILRCTDRSTPRGRRDYAILMLLARFGLRTSEVVRLDLEDFDWELGQITVRGKGGRWSKLPLPPDVGQSLAAYLQHDRPRCSTRRLFVTQRAPITGLSTGGAIVKTVTRALTRAGIVSERKGGYLFRHTLATEMLGRGASLREIGEVLRHRKADTTRIYAKVDFPALRNLAQPWPGGTR